MCLRWWFTLFCHGQFCCKFTYFPSVKFSGLKMCACKKNDKYQVCLSLSFILDNLCVRDIFLPSDLRSVNRAIEKFISFALISSPLWVRTMHSSMVLLAFSFILDLQPEWKLKGKATTNEQESCPAVLCDCTAHAGILSDFQEGARASLIGIQLRVATIKKSIFHAQLVQMWTSNLQSIQIGSGWWCNVIWNTIYHDNVPVVWE